MPRLQGLENRGINIQKLVLPEIENEPFIWDPHRYITSTEWDGIIEYVERKLISKGETGPREAISCASTMATLFPDRKSELPITRKLCEESLFELGQLMTYSDYKDKLIIGLSLIKVMVKVRTFFPDLAVATAATYHKSLDDVRNHIVIQEHNAGDKIEHWYDAAAYILATGKPFPVDKFHSTTEDLVWECQRILENPLWWLDEKAFRTYLDAVLPLWIFSPENIDNVRLSTQAWKGISKMVLSGEADKYPYSRLMTVFKLTLLAAKEVRTELNGIQIVLPTHQEVKEQNNRNVPPTRRSF